MLLVAGFCAVLSFLIVGKRRIQKNKLSEEANALMNDYRGVHKSLLELKSQASAINEINKMTVTEIMQKSILNQIDVINDEIKVLEAEYRRLKPLYDKKKNEEEEEERRRRRRRAAAAASSGGYYGGSSSSSSRSSSSSWGGGGGGFSGGGASGGW